MNEAVIDAESRADAKPGSAKSDTSKSDPPLDEAVEGQLSRPYDAGFVTDIEQEFAPPGLDEDIIRFISSKKDEPGVVT